MQNHTKGIIYAVITALFWAVLAIGLKVAVRKVDATTIVWFRFCLAFFPMLIWHIFMRPRELKILIKPPVLLVIAALALAYNYIGFMWGVQYTSPSNAQLFVQAGPLLLTLAGVIFFHEKLRPVQLAGFLLTMVGLALFFNQQLGGFASSEKNYIKGVLLTISGAFTWAIYATLQKKLVTRYPTFTLNLFIFGLPTLLYLPFANFSQLTDLSWQWWLLLIFLGINTLIAYTTLSLSLQYIEASKVSIIVFLNPILTFLIMGTLTYLEVSWIDGENFTPLSIIGAAIVFAGAIFVVKRKKMPKQPKAIV